MTPAWIEKACNGDRPKFQDLSLQEAIEDYEMLYGKGNDRPARRPSSRTRLMILVLIVAQNIKNKKERAV
ncbi:hypothetical protein SD70_27735 [Gordoniibacillus kamchatkensis]|uniref:Uncharacterized protein n=1 Tax=Gordoniibacillus kamchatkensis TaxID=1590651 RepID=A0ABR5AB05_9BACL|nr:hypothetical protein [Paenibacillus sp. VKM B-2647]KIL38221.1 hypothetical protein SD70_27735 [Paenibacillus sp. VKM B-2647]